MSIIVRDKILERRVASEQKRRSLKSAARTLTELATERLSELEIGRFLPGHRADDAPRNPQNEITSGNQPKEAEITEFAGNAN